MKSSNMNARTAVSGSTEFPWKWKLEDLDKRPKHGHTVFSCFSCGGGSSMGYKLAGFDVVGNCEIDPDMMKVYKQNNHPKHSFLMDVRDFLKLPDEKMPEELFALDVLDGSPPCSVFSTAGSREEGWNVEKVFREGQAKQRLDDLFLFFIAIAKRLQPKVVVAENVKGIITGNAKGWVNQIVRAFDDAGYVVQIFLFNAARMGVPQKRERVFFIAHRKDLEYPKLSMEFHSRPVLFGDVRDPYGKAMDGNSIAAKLLKYRIPSDRCIADINARVRRKKNNGFTTPILSDDEPAYTIVAGSSMYRMCDGLLLTDKDIISCQTFPQDYDFMGQSVQYICGMSVPPVMMAKISEQVYRQWLKGSDADGDAEAEKV
nr:DNA (cytosine-5-)-methyltransferase [uncultured Acetatifactor sp.]